MPMPTPQQRLSQRERPYGQRQVMWQEWRDLLLLNWRWDAEEIQRRLPPGLFVDTFDGDAWVSIVPFFMRNIRPKGFPPVSRLSNFMELNVRTYVHDGRGRTGVWFFSLDAASTFAVWVGNQFYGLPYHRSAMRYNRDAEGMITHCSKRSGGGLCIHRYRQLNPLPQPTVESLEFFLVERYGFFSLNRGKLCFVRVYHEPYELWNVESDATNTPLFVLNGLAKPATAFDHAVFSPGVKVRIYSRQWVSS